MNGPSLDSQAGGFVRKITVKEIIKRVQKKYSNKGRKRKVFNQGNAKIFFTGRSVTANAGMAPVSRTFETFHIPEQLKAATADIDQDKRYPTHELLQQLIALGILGGEAIRDRA